MNIHKKSLKHVSDILRSYDTYPIYNSLVAAMTEAGIDEQVRLKIISKYQSEIAEQTKKICDAKDWIDTLILDMQ